MRPRAADARRHQRHRAARRRRAALRVAAAAAVDGRHLREETLVDREHVAERLLHPLLRLLGVGGAAAALVGRRLELLRARLREGVGLREGDVALLKLLQVVRTREEKKGEGGSRSAEASSLMDALAYVVAEIIAGEWRESSGGSLGRENDRGGGKGGVGSGSGFNVSCA